MHLDVRMYVDLISLVDPRVLSLDGGVGGGGVAGDVEKRMISRENFTIQCGEIQCGGYNVGDMRLMLNPKTRHDVWI